MKTSMYTRLAVVATVLFISAGTSAIPLADAARHERAVIKSFSEGDYDRYVEQLASLITEHPVDPIAFLHYRDFFRCAEHAGAARIAGIAERIRDAIGRSGDDRANACLLHFNCEMERLLYRSDPPRAKKLTDDLRPVRTWMLYGPYRKYGPGDLDSRFQPEVISAGSEIHPQKRIRIAEADGWLDPGKYIFPAAGVVYAKASFRSRETVKIRIFSRSLYTVFVNGRVAARNREESRRNMRMIVAEGRRGLTVLVKLYGAPLEKMRMIVTDGHDAVLSPDMEPDISFSGDGDVAEEPDFPYAALAAGRDDDPRTEARLGIYFDNLGSAEACDHYRKSLSLARDTFVSYRLAVSLMGAGADRLSGDYSEGADIITRLARTQPSFVPARVKWLESLVEKGDYDEALGEAKRLTSSVPKNPYARILYLRLLNRLDYEKEFMERAAQAAARFPGSAGIRAEEADYYRNRDRGTYCDAMRKLVNMDYTPERARSVAREYAGRGDYGTALDLIGKYNFNNDFVHEKVEIHIRKGDFETARHCVLPALMKSDDPWLYQALGFIDLLQSEDPSMYFQKALSIEPSRHGLADYLRYCVRGAVENPFTPFIIDRESVDFSWYRKKYGGFPSAILARERIFTLEKDGGSRVFCEDIIQVNDGEGVRKWRAVMVPYRGRIRPVRMRVYGDRGGFSDSCTVKRSGTDTVIVVDSLSEKSILHLAYIIDDPITAPRGSVFFSLSPESLQQYNEPVRRASIQVVAPAGMKVDFRFNPATPVRSAMSDGFRIYSASLADIPAIPQERYGGGRMNGLSFYSFSTMRGFGDFAAWYGGIVRDAAGPVPRQAALFMKERLEDSVAGVYDFIAREIRTDGTALFNPVAAGTTFFRKRGSVENKVLLARAMLRGLGIRSYIAFARDRALPDAGAYVSHDYFTAILLYVPLDVGHALWLDFSNGSFRCGATADGVTGTTALVLLTDAYRFRKIE